MDDLRTRPLCAQVALFLACLLLHRSPGSAAAVYIDPLAVRGSAQIVQNTVGNAVGLQAGLCPRLQVGRHFTLRLLGEYGGLRTVARRYFSVPSAQLLLGWQANDRLELTIGAGSQFWLSPATGPIARPIATVEAHYLPHNRLGQALRSLFVASSLGAGAQAGLQVRAGLEFHLATAERSPKSAPEPIGGVKAAVPPEHPVLAAPAAAAPLAPTPAIAQALANVAADYVEQTILFAFNSAHLDEHACGHLDALAAALTAHEPLWSHIELVGHGDAIGSRAGNLIVSMRRVRAVREYLESHSVAASKISVHAVGEAEPRPALPATAAEQRRVSIGIGIAQATGDEGRSAALKDALLAAHKQARQK